MKIEIKKWTFVLFCLVTCSFSCQKKVSKYLQESDVSLSPPQLSIENVFFDSSTRIECQTLKDGILIRYTDDGSEPTEDSPIAKFPLTAKSSKDLRFKAAKKGFLPSRTVRKEIFKKVPLNYSKFNFTDPKSPYNIGPSKLLFDHKKGSLDFRSNAWLGFQDSIVNFDIWFEAYEMVSGIGISVMEDQNSWIFAPEEIQIKFFDNENVEIYSIIEKYENQKEESQSFKFLKLKIQTIKAHKISIQIKASNIPNWHLGKGNLSWLFVDEIFLL